MTCCNERESRRTGLAVAVALMGAACLATDGPGNLVPPTADEDPLVPQIAMAVAGHTRAVHVRTVGDPTRPVLLVLHGSMSDSRAYLPLAALSDRYFVVFWDQRGSGLSERIAREELGFDGVIDEIDRIKALYSPDAPVTLIGHSWGAVYAAMYLAARPAFVAQAVLAEPFGLKGEFTNAIQGDTLNVFTSAMADEVWLKDILAPRDHESLDYQGLLVLTSAVRNYFCDSAHLPPWPVWRVGAFAEIVHNELLMKGSSFDYDFTPGLDRFPRKVLLVGSECSTIGYAFQERYHRALFADAEVLHIEDAGHRLIVEQFDAFLAGVKAYLTGYQDGASPREVLP
jgi:proline iminopeptidase